MFILPSNHEAIKINTKGTSIRTTNILRWKVIPYIPISFKSSMGPIPTNASCAAGGKPINEAATKASASQQMESRKAKIIIPKMDRARFPVKAAIIFGDKKV